MTFGSLFKISFTEKRKQLWFSAIYNHCALRTSELGETDEHLIVEKDPVKHELDDPKLDANEVKFLSIGKPMT